MPDLAPPPPPVELAVAVQAGHHAPQGSAPRDTGAMLGTRVRVRGSERWGIEANAGREPSGWHVGGDVVPFFTDPSADLVLLGLLGGGVSIGEGAYAELGVGADVGLFPVLDLRVDAVLRVDDAGESALAFTVGPQLHTVRRYDRDDDGVGDRDDACPADAEDADGFADADGCPDTDDDADGLADVDDACPRVAEDRDGFLDRDGCPEPDNDGDGLDDARDACMRFPEDPDGFEDGDGCPDPDNDADTVEDDVDQCPNVAEDADAFDDGDGCPEPDNDGDGVGDRFDGAPLQPETRNGWADEDGVPDALPPVLARFVGPPLPLRFSGARPRGRAMEELALVATVLASFPTVHVEVRVTDPDVALAEARARAVTETLVADGVDAARLVPRGEAGSAAVRLALVP